MFARLLAAFCLLTLLVSSSRAASAGTSDSKLVVYLGAAATQPAAIQEHMKRETAAILRTAGYELEFMARGSRGEAPDAPYLVVVELDGVCTAESRAAEAPAGVKLAATPVADGHVLPFTTISCAALRQTIASSLAGQPPAMRDFLYGRALARVLSHELYHVLAGTRDHAASGIARTCYRAADLVAERFEFEAATLARMRPSTTEAYAFDDSSGR